ncbi:hypothetical protein Ddye_021100 [Dipteronia dyeriana]|uniref:Uncharacterized protein n=1 Tax=Dipteronia dyeriana TaxID=168575 RepID=A0AAD9U0Z6_9ROSI|nr:hypothetical protein Ddye_021100 [Dipteronia dyeriana]
MAVREGLFLAKFYHFPVSILETSSPSVISSLSNSVTIHGNVSFIVNDIKALIFYVGICKCQASSVQEDSLAHRLASIAFSSVQEWLWLDTSPSLSFSVV